MTKKLTVKLDDREVIVEKLPLGKYAELLKAIKELPKHANEFSNLDSQQALALLPTIIGESMPDVIGILAIATPLKPDEIEKLGLDEAVTLVMAVIEVNNYAKVYDQIKKAMARPTTKT